MLFLAVTAGFLAENIREHGIETRREKKLMHALYEDLNADIRQIDSLMIKRKTRNEGCDTLIAALISATPASSPDQHSTIYYLGRLASRRLHFRPQDGTLQQLRNSGGFRVVHDTAVLKAINNYELLLKTNLENIEVEEKELSEYSQVAAKVFNVAVFQQMTSGTTLTYPSTTTSLLSYDKIVLNELAIKLHYWKRTSSSAVERLQELNETARGLKAILDEKYDLK